MKELFAKYAITDRRKAGLTQEQAAEKLHISVRTISDYECGKSLPPDDVVEIMIDTYKSVRIGYIWLRCNRIGHRLLPNTPMQHFESSILHLQSRLKRVNEINGIIVDVGWDGVIEEQEIEQWEKVTEALNDLASAIFSVQMAQKKPSGKTT